MEVSLICKCFHGPSCVVNRFCVVVLLAFDVEDFHNAFELRELERTCALFRKHIPYYLFTLFCFHVGVVDSQFVVGALFEFVVELLQKFFAIGCRYGFQKCVPSQQVNFILHFYLNVEYFIFSFLVFSPLSYHRLSVFEWHA